MADATQFGAFVRAKRHSISPASVGLGTTSRRRVQGLRREELAMRAGISTAYLIRLEQGQDIQVSPGVLRAISQALELSADEVDHLETLSRRDPSPVRPDPEEELRPVVRELVESFDDRGALAVGYWGDVLGWNRIAHRLMAPEAAFEDARDPNARPNLHALLFSGVGKTLFPDWHLRARDAVAALRAREARRPASARFVQLEAVLRRSEEFVGLWAEQDVQLCADRRERYQHADVGSMTLNEEVLELPHDDGQHLIVLFAKTGSLSARRLARLAH